MIDHVAYPILDESTVVMIRTDVMTRLVTLICPETIERTTKRTALIRQRLQAAKSRQESHAELRTR